MPAPLAEVRFIGAVMGRYTLESRARMPGLQIFAARLQSISPTLMVASVPVKGKIGEMVTAHYVPFGNVRGRIARHIDGGIVVDIDADPDARHRLATRIDWFKKRVFNGVTDKREHARFMPREPKTTVVLHNGAVLPCLVIDLSCSGAAVSADYEPAVGEPLAIGKVVARVVRRIDVGFAVQFVQPLPRDTVEEVVRAPEEWDRAMSLLQAAEPPAPVPEAEWTNDAMFDISLGDEPVDADNEAVLYGT